MDTFFFQKTLVDFRVITTRLFRRRPPPPPPPAPTPAAWPAGRTSWRRRRKRGPAPGGRWEKCQTIATFLPAAITVRSSKGPRLPVVVVVVVVVVGEHFCRAPK